MHTGSIVDFYDDPHGHVLKERLPESAQVPDFVKTAEYLTKEARASLPDDVFALVMVDRGEKLRKYACVDKGNTALSVIYFMENHDRLPEEAQKVAAANLLTACDWHGLKPPMGLQKVALLGAAMNAMWMKDSIGQGLKRHKNMLRGMPKVGDMTGSNVMPLSSDNTHVQKQAAVMRPHVDVTGMAPPPRMEKAASAQRYCLIKEGRGRYPIDSYGEVMEAQRWFGDHSRSLHPEDRREYCTKLAARADELGIAVSDQIRKYAGEGFAPDGEIKVAVSTRMQFWAEDAPERDMLNGLMDKYASVSPEIFCEALRQFDETTGLHHYWDDAIYDPWYSTYGIDKTAEWKFDHAGDRLTESQLRQVTRASYPLIREKFGEDLAKGLRDNPQQIFDSLPLDAKRIIMRMANDPQPHSARVMS